MRKDVNKIADDLIEWAQFEDSYDFEDFCEEHEIDLLELLLLGHTNEYFTKCIEVSKALVGQRRVVDAVNGLIDKRHTWQTQHMYDDTWHDKFREKGLLPVPCLNPSHFNLTSNSLFPCLSHDKTTAIS